VRPDDSVLATDVLGDLGREPMALYEVLYAANTLFPSAPMSARVAASERTIRRLVAEGRVRLWRGVWIGPEHDRTSVPTSDLEAEMLRHSTWSPESGDPVVWMELTSVSA
jgi:hypothetical protein